MIYTKCGDEGYSSVINKTNIKKDNSIFALLGDLDELGAHLGVCKYKSPCVADKISALQTELIELASWIAGYGEFDATGCASNFEVVIDTIENAINIPSHIIQNGANEKCAYIDLCRAVARRCERSAVTFCCEYGFNSSLLTYLNRLSDYLFVLARYAEQI